MVSIENILKAKPKNGEHWAGMIEMQQHTTWALRQPGDRIGMFSSCNSDEAFVFWQCTRKLRPGRAVE